MTVKGNRKLDHQGRIDQVEEKNNSSLSESRTLNFLDSGLAQDIFLPPADQQICHPSTPVRFKVRDIWI